MDLLKNCDYFLDYYKDVNDEYCYGKDTCGDTSPDLKNCKLGDASTKDKIKQNINWIWACTTIQGMF